MRSKDWPFFKPLWSLCVKKSMHIRPVLAADPKSPWRNVYTYPFRISTPRRGQKPAPCNATCEKSTRRASSPLAALARSNQRMLNPATHSTASRASALLPPSQQRSIRLSLSVCTRLKCHLLRPSGRPNQGLDAVIATFRVDGDLQLAMKPPVASDG